MPSHHRFSITARPIAKTPALQSRNQEAPGGQCFLPHRASAPHHTLLPLSAKTRTDSAPAHLKSKMRQEEARSPIQRHPQPAVFIPRATLQYGLTLNVIC